MPGVSLFHLITDDARLIEQMVDAAEENGVSREEATEQAVATMDLAVEAKVLSYCKLILTLEADASAAKELEKRMAAKRQAKENLAERLRARMVELLPKDYKAQDPEVTMAFKKSTAVNDSKLTTEQLEALPETMRRTVPAKLELVKAEAAKVLKTGQLLPGLSLEERWTVNIK
jgi:hypothetical protein